MKNSIKNCNKNSFVRFENVHKSFRGKVVLDGISLDICQGEVFCIIGRSGIGKSVLIKHITRLMEPDRGTVFYQDKDILSFNKKEIFQLRKEVSMLFQSGALFDSMNVEENLSLPLEEHTSFTATEIKEKVEEKLAMVGMPGVQKLKTSELSGGMKKRVGLARSIILEPKAVLYDEPTTGLDPIMSDVIDKLIINLNSRLNITSIVITHDMNSVRAIADKVAMLHDGKIIFVGTVDEIEQSKDINVQKFIRGISD